MHKILFVEDDELYASTLIDFFSDYEFEITHVKSATEALEKLYRQNFDLYLLDINLKNSNGIDLLNKLRNSNDNRPALFLTSDPSSKTALECFKVGCDDYIRKQCDIVEIVERIRVSIKKNFPQKGIQIELGNDCIFDPVLKILSKDNKELELAQKELILLEILVKKIGVTVSWDEIGSALWAPSENISFASVRVYVNTLKKYLGKNSILNIKGVGYKLAV